MLNRQLKMLYFGTACMAESVSYGYVKGIFRGIIDENRGLVQVGDNYLRVELSGIKPILRSMNDITEGEMFHVSKGILDSSYMVNTKEKFDDIILTLKEAPSVIFFLYQLGVDVFGLIDKGLAIDEKTLK